MKKFIFLTLIVMIFGNTFAFALTNTSYLNENQIKVSSYPGIHNKAIDIEEVIYIISSKKLKIALFERGYFRKKMHSFYLEFLGEGAEKSIVRVDIVYTDMTIKSFKIAYIKDTAYQSKEEVFNNFDEMHDNLNALSLFDDVLVEYFLALPEYSVIVGNHVEDFGFISPFAIDYIQLMLFYMSLDFRYMGLWTRDARDCNCARISMGGDLSATRMIDYPLSYGSMVKWEKVSMPVMFYKTKDAPDFIFLVIFKNLLKYYDIEELSVVALKSLMLFTKEKKDDFLNHLKDFNDLGNFKPVIYASITPTSIFYGYDDLYGMTEDVKRCDRFTRVNEKYYNDSQRIYYYLSPERKILYDSYGEHAEVDRRKFILSPGGDLYAYNEKIRSIYSIDLHSVLAGGLKIACGGYITIKEGLVTAVNNMTGHYKCTSKGTLNVLDYILRNGTYKKFTLEHLYPLDGAIKRIQFNITNNSVSLISQGLRRQGHRLFSDPHEISVFNGIGNQQAIVSAV